MADFALGADPKQDIQKVKEGYVMRFKTVLLFIIAIWVSNLGMGFAQDTLGLSVLKDRYALVIGISNYKDKDVKQLSYGAKDAVDFRAVLKKAGRFGDQNVRLLIDSTATRENIRTAVEGWLQPRVTKDDMVMIFFSGHGSQSQDYDKDEEDELDEYILPFDFDHNDYSSGICDDTFASWIRNLRSENILIIFDCCYSGGAAKQKGFSASGYKGGIVKDDFLKDLNKEIPKPGTAVMTACKADQVSFEHPKLKNGVFTYHLIQAINSMSDVDLDNTINEQELFSSTQSKVISFSRDNCEREQDPVLISSLRSSLNLFFLWNPTNITANTDTTNMIQYQLQQLSNRHPIEELPLRQSLYRLSPNDLENLARLAELQFSFSKFDNALYYYELLDSKVNNDNCRRQVAEIYLLQEKYKKAIEWLEKCEATEDVLAKKVDAFLGLGDTTHALGILSSYISGNRLQKFGYMKMFYIYFSQGTYRQAQIILNKCRALNPLDMEVLYWTGYIEKYVNHNTVVGDSLLHVFYSDHTVNFHLRVAFSRDLERCLRNYPYLKEFQKAKILSVASPRNEPYRKRHLALYKLYAKLDLDEQFVREQDKLTNEGRK